VLPAFVMPPQSTWASYILDPPHVLAHRPHVESQPAGDRLPRQPFSVKGLYAQKRSHGNHLPPSFEPGIDVNLDVLAPNSQKGNCRFVDLLQGGHVSLPRRGSRLITGNRRAKRGPAAHAEVIRWASGILGRSSRTPRLGRLGRRDS
jgi:hypothetical protein